MSSPLDSSCFVAGEKVQSDERFTIRFPFDGRIVGTVRTANRKHVEAAINAALGKREPLTRYERSQILEKARAALESRRDEFADLITSESGLCLRETRYEVGRTIDVLRFAAIEALRDDGQVFSCDISAQGKARKIFTLREPVSVVVAITPFNHPLM